MNEGSMAQISSTLLMAKPYADMCPQQEPGTSGGLEKPGAILTGVW